MCEQCVKQQYPHRDTCCLDNGSYFLNFIGCASCHKMDGLQIVERVEEETEDGEEQVTYQHICQDCGHVVANHEYTFKVEDEFQVYEMECLLCGTAEDSRSIMPHDPRQQPMFF